MDKKGLILLILLILITLNTAVANDVDNSTDITSPGDGGDVLKTPAEDDIVSDSDLISTQINAEDNVAFDCIGDYYTINLVDNNNKALPNEKVSFTVNGITYNQTTDLNGFSSLQINLADGVYEITTNFAGNKLYEASSKVSTITVNNTRYVEEGLTNNQIQKVIDDAKPNNVIIFKGKLYNDLNLEISKSLTIISNVNTQIKSSSAKPVFTINGKESSLTAIKGFKIDSGGNGIVVKNSDFVEIYNNEITSKGYGILAESTQYLNITKNKINGNGKDGVVIALSENAYIIGNDLSKNNGNGLAIGASKNIYVYSNTLNENKKDGILLDTEVGNTEYGSGPQNLFIEGNTIKNNNGDGIEIKKAGHNINITKNTISNNIGNGIAIYKIGDNTIKSNVIGSNGQSGIRFKEAYVKPKNQNIEHNVIIGNQFREVDARETYYDEGKYRLDIGENWYGDNPNICPKIKTSNLIFSIKQTSSYFFTVTITDSKGNIVSDLPARVGSYKVQNGRTKYFTLNNGIATIEVDASDNSNVLVTIDDATRSAKYKFEDPSYEQIYVPPYDDRLRPIDEVGQPYPGIPRPGLYQNIPSNNGDNGNGQNSPTNNQPENGNGNGESSGDGSGNGNGNGGGNGYADSGTNGSSKRGSEFTGNSTTTQNTDPGNSANNPSTSESSTEYQSADSPANSAPSDGSSMSQESQSVVKQIILDEDELIRVNGLSFLILLILLTVIYYYRDDIKKMKSEM